MSEALPLFVHSIGDRGRANLERIVLQVIAPANLSEFGVTLALQTESGPSPYQDNCFWFASPQTTVRPGDWVFIYTSPGQPAVSDLTTPFQGKLYTFYWGRSQTAFFHPSVVPVLFRVYDYSTLPAPPYLLPQPQSGRSLLGQQADDGD